MPRANLQDKLTFINTKIEHLKELEPHDHSVRVQLKAAKHEQHFITTYNALTSKEDRDRWTANKTYDLKIEDELAAKYGLGPSDHVTALKNVYSDYSVRKVENTGVTKKVTYKPLQSQCFKATPLHVQPLDDDDDDSEDEYEYTYSDGDYSLEVTDRCVERAVSGFYLRNHDTTFVKSSDAETSLSTSTPNADEPPSKKVCLPSKRQIYETYARKWKAYRAKCVPNQLCASNLCVSKRQLIFKVSTHFSRPQLKVSCLCGKGSEFSSDRGFLSGSLTSKDITVMGRTNGNYYVRTSLELVGAQFLDEIHQQHLIEDQFLHHVFKSALRDWEIMRKQRIRRKT